MVYRCRKPRLCLIAFAISSVSTSSIGETPTKPPAAAEPMVSPAADGIFAAFQHHPLVGLGDAHGLAEEGDFYVRLIRDPRFAAEVGNVVVETAGSAQQATLDRYINGEDLPRAELRKVWSEVVGWSPPTVTAVEYLNFLAEVRAVNRQLPPAHRIRVWAGEPPVDWATIKSQADLQPLLMQRDATPASIIEREILGRGRKALVIYGSLHFFSPPAPPGTSPPLGLRGLLEHDHPGAFYVVAPYKGFFQPECSSAFEAKTRWARGSLISPVQGTSVEALLTRPGCTSGPPPQQPPGAPPIPPEILAKIVAPMQRALSGADADALLFLGDAASLTRSADDPDLVADPAYSAEIRRRLALVGLPLDALLPLASRKTPYAEKAAPAPPGANKR